MRVISSQSRLTVFGFYNRFTKPFAVLILFLVPSFLHAQDGGGGTLPGDILGGAALIFRKPDNPPVGGGRISARPQPRAKIRAQNQLIAKGNAARSAATPRYSEAEQTYLQAARQDPDDVRAFVGLGNVYLDQGKFAQAVEQYQRAIKVRPEYVDTYMPLGFALVRLNRLPEAIDIYNHVIKVEPENPEPHNNLSYIFNQSGKYNEAIEAGQQAIRLLGQTGLAYKQGYQVRNQILSHAYKNLGNAYSGLKKYNEAADALKQATAIEPNNAAAHFNLGLSLYSGGRYSEAILAYKEVLKLKPALAVARFNLALAYIATNDRTSAMAEYDALKKINAKMADELYAMIKR